MPITKNMQKLKDKLHKTKTELNLLILEALRAGLQTELRVNHKDISPTTRMPYVHIDISIAELSTEKQS